MQPSEQPNIIQQTRDIIQNMNQQQRFRKAKRHLMDAVNSKHPRNDFETNQSKYFRRIYLIQTSTIWDYILFLLGFVFMYLIIGEPTNRQHKNEQIRFAIVFLQMLILFLYWADIVMEIYHKYYWKAQQGTKFPILFQVKVILISAMTIDALVYYPLYKTYPVRLFRILRPFLPYLYNRFARRALQSFASTYKDIICYTVFYFTIIFAFGIIGTQLINLPPEVQYDFYNENYENVGQTSFLFYILASFDSWPDYWELAVDQSKWHYIFLVAFIFLNYFYFVTIPTSVMFNSFKKTRSALLLVDQIHQQNSLLLCFICLGEDNLCIKLETFHQFMLYAYRNKLRLIDHIKQISFRLGGHHNNEIFISDFMKICKIIEEDPDMCPPAYDDWEPYIKFRNFLKDRLKLKKIINSLAFNVTVIIITLINLVLIIVSIPVKKLNNINIEYAFLIIFEIEIAMRLLGTGIQKFCSKLANVLELGLACLYLLLLSCNRLIDDSVLIELLGILRIFRIPRIFNVMLVNNYFKRFYYNNVLFRKIRVVFQDLYVSIAIGVKMFPLFMTLYYILGIIGIEAYDETFLEQQSSPYSVYDKVANFRTFLFSQIVIVQSMVQAGWSMIIFDHSVRFGNTALVYIYFIMIHIFIDTTIFSLMKGMVADLYETISLEFEALDKLEEQELEDEKQEQKKKDEIAEIRKILEEGVELGYDSLKKKEIYENKLDRQMMENLKAALNKKSVKSFKRFKTLRSVIFAKSAEQILKQQRDDGKGEGKLDKERPRSPNLRRVKKQKMARVSIDCIEEKPEKEGGEYEIVEKKEERKKERRSSFDQKSKIKEKERSNIKESQLKMLKQAEQNQQQRQERLLREQIDRQNERELKMSKKKSKQKQRQAERQKEKEDEHYQKIRVQSIQDQQIYIKTSLQTEEKLRLQTSKDQQSDSDTSSMSIGDSDIEEIQDNLLDRIILKQQQIPYAEAPVYPRFLLQFLGRKMIIARERIEKEGAFNPNTMGIRSKNSLSFYTNLLELLLQIKKTEQERKDQIAEDILKLMMPNGDTTEINNKKLEKEINKNLSKVSMEKQVLITPIVRKIMLSNISQEFIKKFQIEYFSSVYGNSFRQINRTTLDPLLRHEAFILYNFHRTLRYPPPQIDIFWNILATIQDNVSRTLLHDGSIFTFVFEVEQLAGNWFAIEVRENMEIKVHFLKTGIWIYSRGMKFDDVYYAQDIFHCSDEELHSNQNAEKTIKLLYNAFETLGFSMLNQTDFFDSDPARHSYDLYTFVLNCENTERCVSQQEKKYGNSLTVESESQKPKNFNLKITKMMGVILSKETERPAGKELKYELTNLKKILEQRLEEKKQKAFRFDEDENKTYKKLESLAEEEEYERLIYSESLEYAFIVDAVESVRDSCQCYLDNLINQAEIVLNKEFSKVHSKAV